MSVVHQISDRLFSVFKDIVPPPSQWKARSKKPRTEDILASLGRLHEEAKSLRRQHRPGVITRARIVLRLQQELSTAGYPADMSRQVLFSLTLSAFVGKV